MLAPRGEGRWAGYARTAAAPQSARHWTKLTVVCHTGNHLFAAATVTTGPSNDAAKVLQAAATLHLAGGGKALGCDEVVGPAIAGA